MSSGGVRGNSEGSKALRRRAVALFNIFRQTTAARRSAYPVKELISSRDESTESKGFTRESNLLSEYTSLRRQLEGGPFIADPVRCLAPFASLSIP